MPCRFLKAAVLGAAAILLVRTPSPASALQDYVGAPDPSFHWSKVSSADLASGARLVELELQSQTWRGTPWTHHLLVIEPGEAARAAHDNHHAAMLYITGDYDGGATARVLAYFASVTGAPTAILYDVPRQPLFGDLREDDLIAYTFVKYAATGDATWPLLFPMVKSAVSAMTAIQQLEGNTVPIDHFVVSGASKRGWTTWLTALVDERVAGIVPVVYNNLNLKAQMPHQLESWGKYSEQIDAYVKTGLLKSMDASPGRKLTDMVDPFTERYRLVMPKLLVNATNDRYWTLDAADLYLDALPGDKHLLYVPNNEHGIRDYDRLLHTAAAFFNATVAGRRLPDLSAEAEVAQGHASLKVGSSSKPVSIVAWVATTTDGDFRSVVWTSHPMTASGNAYVFGADMPRTGHMAMFAEASYVEGGVPYRLSSPLEIEPKIGK